MGEVQSPHVKRGFGAGLVVAAALYVANVSGPAIAAAVSAAAAPLTVIAPIAYRFTSRESSACACNTSLYCCSVQVFPPPPLDAIKVDLVSK